MRGVHFRTYLGIFKDVLILRDAHSTVGEAAALLSARGRDQPTVDAGSHAVRGSADSPPLGAQRDSHAGRVGCHGNTRSQWQGQLCGSSDWLKTGSTAPEAQFQFLIVL